MTDSHRRIPQKITAILVYGRLPLVFGGMLCAVAVMWDRNPALYTLGVILLLISMTFDLVDGWFAARHYPHPQMAELADRILDKLVYSIIFPLVAVGAMWRLHYVVSDPKKTELLHAILVLFLAVTVLVRDNFAHFMRGVALRFEQEIEYREFARLRTIVAAPVGALLYAYAFYIPERLPLAAVRLGVEAGQHAAAHDVLHRDHLFHHQLRLHRKLRWSRSAPCGGCTTSCRTQEDRTAARHSGAVPGGDGAVQNTSPTSCAGWRCVSSRKSKPRVCPAADDRSRTGRRSALRLRLLYPQRLPLPAVRLGVEAGQHPAAHDVLHRDHLFHHQLRIHRELIRRYGTLCLDELCLGNISLRRRILAFFPNALTVMNAMMGLLAVFFAYQDRMREASLFLIGAALFDKLDGAVARRLGLTEPLPGEVRKPRAVNLGGLLDDISDAVSFCIAPAWIFYIAWRTLPTRSSRSFPSAGSPWPMPWPASAAWCISPWTRPRSPGSSKACRPRRPPCSSSHR